VRTLEARLAAITAGFVDAVLERVRAAAVDQLLGERHAPAIRPPGLGLPDLPRDALRGLLAVPDAELARLLRGVQPRGRRSLYRWRDIGPLLDPTRLAQVRREARERLMRVRTSKALDRWLPGACRTLAPDQERRPVPLPSKPR
jgi:hypothetical protein